MKPISSFRNLPLDSWVLLIFISIYFVTLQFVFPERVIFQKCALFVGSLVLVLSWIRLIFLESPWLRFASWFGILTSLVLSGLPFELENPFNFFSYGLFQNALGILPLLVLTHWADQRDNQQLNARLQFWVPVIFLAGINSFYILLNYRELMPFDTSRHAANALSIFHSLSGDGAMKIWEALIYYDFYHPLTYIIPSPFLFLFGVSYTTLNLVQSLFWLPMGYWAAFKILRFLRFGFGVSALVAFTCFAGTLATSLTRHFMQDLSVLTMLLWFQYFLLRSGFLKHRKMSVLAGLFFGLGLLTKANFLMFGLGSLLTLGFALFKKRQLEKSIQRVDRLVWFFVPVILTIGLWYVVNQAHYNYTLPGMKNWAADNQIPNAAEMASFFWYWPSVPHLGGKPFFFLFLVGIIWAIWKNKGVRLPYFYGLPAALFAVAVLSTVPTKDQRTIFPILAFMIIPVGYLLQSGRKVMTVPMIALLVSFYMVRLYAQTFDWKLPAGITPNPFSVYSKPMAPSIESPNLSYFTYKKLMEANFEDEALPPLQFGQEINYHTKLAFSLLVPEIKPHFSKQKSPSGAHVFFTRSKLWQDHYLWQVEKEGDLLRLKDLGRVVQISADHVIRLDWMDAQGQVLKTDESVMEKETHTWQYPVFSGATSVRIYLRMHYGHPSGQWVKLVYDLLQNPEFQYFDVFHMVFQPSAPPTIYYDFQFSAP